MNSVLQFIAEIGDIVTPIGITVGGIVASIIGIKKWRSKKQENKRWDNVVTLLEKMYEKNTCEEDVQELSEELKKLRVEVKDLKDSLKNDELVTHDQTATLGQMIGVIFENSTLPVETKERLRTLKTKIEYASDAKVVEDLISENSKLAKQVKSLKTEIEDIKKDNEIKIVPDNEADTVTEPDSKESHIVIQ